MGHSFGHLTALCVSGCLTLEDGLKLAVGRVTMEVDPEMTTKLAAECDAEVARYNGATSQVLVGSTLAGGSGSDASPRGS